MKSVFDFFKLAALIATVVLATDLVFRWDKLGGFVPGRAPATPVLVQLHPYYGTALRPGIHGQYVWRDNKVTFSHNLQSMRIDHEVSRELPAQFGRRVLMLGDSVLYGLGISDNDTFVSRLARAWPSVEFVNTGVNGYGQRHELAVFDQLAPVLQPDLAVIIFRWNDVRDNFETASPAFAFDHGAVVRTDLRVPADFDPLAPVPLRTPPPPTAWQQFYNNSPLVNMTKNLIRRLRDRYLTREARHRLRAKARRVAVSLGLRDGDVYDADTVDRPWEITRQQLDLFGHRADELGVRLLVVSIPAFSVVNEAKYGKAFARSTTDIEARLERICSELGIDYIDLAPALIAADRRTDKWLYFRDDNHLSPLGNKVTADILLDVLRPYIFGS